MDHWPIEYLKLWSSTKSCNKFRAANQDLTCLFFCLLIILRIFFTFNTIGHKLLLGYSHDSCGLLGKEKVKQNLEANKCSVCSSKLSQCCVTGAPTSLPCTYTILVDEQVYASPAL